jgi:plasmid stability protein
MPTLVIRNIEADLHLRLLASALANSRSMEEEVRVLLRTSFSASEQIPRQSFGEAMRALFAPLDVVELEIPDRERGDMGETAGYKYSLVGSNRADKPL